MFFRKFTKNLRLRRLNFAFLGVMTAAVAFTAVGCGNSETLASIVGINETGTVIARRAMIRSSYAVVAADLLEVKRGERLEILDESKDESGEIWYNVRASNEEATEGWIEARNLLPEKVMNESRKIADEFKDIPAQAAGQLRASANLRLTPEVKNDNIMLKLENGSTFDIIEWKRVPKVEPSPTPKVAGSEAEDAVDEEKQEPKTLDEKYDVWYKVRLDPSISPAPAGWIFGRQIEIAVPSDIVFQRGDRDFVAWHRLDGDGGVRDIEIARDTESAKEVKPGNWVILERAKELSPSGEEPDFDRIYVIGYDKTRQEHYRVYRSGNVRGYLPMHIAPAAESRGFSVRLKGADGQLRDYAFGVFKDAKGVLRVNAPADIPKDEKK